MISIENRAAFARAEQKARQIRPHVSVIKFGQYSVASTEPGKSYTVTFSKDHEGHWQAECQCAAHTKAKKPLACYHIVSAGFTHKLMAGIRKEVRAAQEAAPVQADPWIVGQATKDGIIDENGYINVDAILSASTVKGVITTSNQEIDRLIDQANEDAALEYDRACLFG